MAVPKGSVRVQIQTPAGVPITLLDLLANPAHSPDAIQAFTPGAVQLAPASGTWSAYIDLTSKPANAAQVDMLTAAGGKPLSTLTAPVGSGISTATLVGGGGLGSFSFPKVQLASSPTNIAYSAGTTLAAGGGITIAADTDDDVSASNNNAGGGGIQAAQVEADDTQSADTEVFVGTPGGNAIGGPNEHDASGMTITAGGSFDLASFSDLTSEATASATGAAFAGGAISHASDQVDPRTRSAVGIEAQVTAGGLVDVWSLSIKRATTNSTAYMVAVGAGANADQQGGFSTPSGVNIVAQGSPSLAQTNIAAGARIAGQTVSIRSDETTTATANASATAYSPIFFGVAIALADADVNVNEGADVAIQDATDFFNGKIAAPDRTSITGTEGVDVIADEVPKEYTNPSVLAVAIIPIPIEHANDTAVTDANVASSPDALVTAGVRSPSTTLDQVPKSSRGGPITNLALDV